jgi:hypothetical protein
VHLVGLSHVSVSRYHDARFTKCKVRSLLFSERPTDKQRSPDNIIVVKCRML